MTVFEIEHNGKRTVGTVTGEGPNIVTLQIPRCGEILFHKRASQTSNRGYRLFSCDNRELYILAEHSVDVPLVDGKFTAQQAAAVMRRMLRSAEVR